jgi:hypothetical protein
MSDLLKAAIADAKAVRATALENAKAALQEAFAPQLQSMLATKLQQEVEDDFGADELPEDPASPVDAPVSDEVPVDDAPSFDGDFGSEEPDGDEVDGDVELPVSGDEFGDEEDFGGEEEFSAPAPEDDDEFPVDEVLGQGHVNPVDQTEFFTEEKASPDYTKTTSGYRTPDPQGASKEWSGGPRKGETKGTSGTLGSKGGSTSASSDYKKMPSHGGPVKSMKNSAPKTDDPQGPSNEFLEENDINDNDLDEILRELESEVAMDNGGQEDYQPSTGAFDPNNMSEDEEVDLSGLFESDHEDDEDESEEEEKEDKKPEWLKENISLKKELQEYRSAVQYLRDRINEVNLLNAKLLYTNKLFKQASLTNEQKLKVIESFDLTKSVREAKLIYATLTESFNFGVKRQVSKQAPARKVTVAKTITEGLASKRVASTKPMTAVINEGTEMANRFMKLAGIQRK